MWLRYKVALAVGLVATSFTANALSSSLLDLRANAMGGAGVAAANGMNAVFINPALLMAVGDFDTVPVVVAARFVDPKNLEDELDRYQQRGLEVTFETSLSTFKSDPTAPSGRSNIAQATQNIIAQLGRFSARAAIDEVNSGFAVGLSNQQRRTALTLAVTSLSAGRVVNVASGVDLFAGVITAMNEGLETTDDAFNIVLSGPARNFKPSLATRGALIYELGWTMAREITFGDHKMMLGVTPKYVDVTTFDTDQALTDATFNSKDGQQRYASFNVDVGLSKEYANGWRSGVVIRDLVPHEYRTALGNAIKVGPQARLGVAKTSDWLSLAMDLDLNQRDTLGLGANAQYLGVGAEIAVTDSARLRAGYRYSIKDASAHVVTVGAGFSLFGMAADIAMALNEDELELSAQLGLRF